MSSGKRHRRWLRSLRHRSTAMSMTWESRRARNGAMNVMSSGGCIIIGAVVNRDGPDGQQSGLQRLVLGMHGWPLRLSSAVLARLSDELPHRDRVANKHTCMFCSVVLAVVS